VTSTIGRARNADEAGLGSSPNPEQVTLRGSAAEAMMES
jgi:hypothetical protein